MGSDSFEWSTDLDNGTSRRKTLLTMQDNRRIPRVGSTSAPMTVSIGRQRPPARLRGDSTLKESTPRRYCSDGGRAAPGDCRTDCPAGCVDL
jgi:hypothetical protein